MLFLQRPFLEEQHLLAAKKAKQCRRVIWSDWDDDLFCVPEDNPSHGTYSNDKIKENVAEIAARSDVVTVSTEQLKRRIDPIRKSAGKHECFVIPNALQDFHVLGREERDPIRRKLIFWRGSASHQKDLMTVSHNLIELMKSRPDWTIHFLGYNPFWITEHLSRKQCILGGAMDILDYHEYAMKIQAGITIVPLADNEFNRAKSNIAWMETTLAHSQTVAPNFEEWIRPGITNYDASGPNAGANFIEALKQAMADVEANDHSKPEASWKFITENLLLSQMSQKRFDILKALCPHKKV